jgi:KDO2-lipid IV(A) lauroyltransferase
MYTVIGYRRKVIQNNLQIAFPEKSEEEKRQIGKKFYRNFIDSLIESIKMLSASDAFLQKHVTGNWEIFNKFYDQGRSCQIHVGHTFNWEWAHHVLAKNSRHIILGVYMPIANKIFDRLFFNLRSRGGTVMLPATDMRNAFMRYRNSLYILALAADQSPGDASKAYWLNFFGKPTPFVTGPEKGARTNNVAVIFAFIEKIRRGYYNVVLTIEEQQPGETAEGELTIRYVRFLENVIRNQPDMWLWSHRRWKKEWKEEFKPQWIGE